MPSILGPTVSPVYRASVVGGGHAHLYIGAWGVWPNQPNPLGVGTVAFALVQKSYVYKSPWVGAIGHQADGVGGRRAAHPYA